MPRSKNSKSTSNNKSIQPAQPINNSIQPVQQNPGFLSNVIQGFALGTGSSLARSVFQSASGSNSKNTEPIKNEKINNDDCYHYKKCKEITNIQDSFECLNNLNIKEYEKCKPAFNLYGE